MNFHDWLNSACRALKIQLTCRKFRQNLFSKSIKLNNFQFERKICGSLEKYDKAYDRINTKASSTANRLKRINRVYHKVTTTDDPVIRSVRSPLSCLFHIHRNDLHFLIAKIACQNRRKRFCYWLYNSHVNVLQSLRLSMGHCCFGKFDIWVYSSTWFIILRNYLFRNRKLEQKYF